MNGKNRKLAVIIAAIILLAVLVVCAVIFLPDKQENTGAADAAAGDVAEGEAPVQRTGVPIETAYLTLYYPEEFADEVMLKYDATEDGYVINVFAQNVGAGFELFTMEFTNADSDGYKLGELKGEDGEQVGVYMLMNQQSAEDWSAEDYETINLLQSTANDLIMQLNENANFVAE